jgi:hypothetical protein
MKISDKLILLSRCGTRGRAKMSFGAKDPFNDDDATTWAPLRLCVQVQPSLVQVQVIDRMEFGPTAP